MKKLSLLQTLQALCSGSRALSCPLFLISDLEILSTLAKDSLRTKTSGEPALFLEGKGSGRQAFEVICQGSLFAEPPPIFLSLSQKHSAKLWKEEFSWLKDLPKNSQATLLVVLPMSFRVVTPELEKLGIDAQVLWNPSSQNEFEQCATFLAEWSLGKDFPHLAANKQKWVQRATQHYGSDLESLLGHFRNMRLTGLGFEDSLMSGNDTGGFQVVDCLASQDFASLALRLSQCAYNGENGSGVFSAICYFMKQVAAVQDQLKASGHSQAPSNASQLKPIFDRLQVPFPSQSRVFGALQRFGIQEVRRFFFEAPKLELTLRTHSDPFGVLALELKKLYPGAK